MPQSWDVSVTAGGMTFPLETAQPAYRANGTPHDGLDLEATYVGLGSEADFAGRDVQGKAVFIFGMLGVGSDGAIRRADRNGAAVIFDVRMLPGNMTYQAYPSGTEAPTFSLGHADGRAVRDLIIKAAGGEAPRVHVRLDVEMVPELKTSLVWGTLPGATDETIYIMAHRDGWFDASGDNASGVASMIGLAEHYANVPESERRRTIVFLGLDGHHNSGLGQAVGGFWLMDHRDELFAKTALMLNCEHPSTVQTSVRPRYLGRMRSSGPIPLHGPAMVCRWTFETTASEHRSWSAPGIWCEHLSRAQRGATCWGPWLAGWARALAIRTGGRDQRLLSLLPHRRRNPRDGTLDGARGVHACLCADHR